MNLHSLCYKWDRFSECGESLGIAFSAKTAHCDDVSRGYVLRWRLLKAVNNGRLWVFRI